MGLRERFEAERRRRRSKRTEQAWPVGPGAVPLGDRFHGHDTSQFSPEEYGDYVATSNDVYAAATLRARQMSRLRLQLFQGRDSGKKEIANGPAYDLLRHVNQFWTWRRLSRMDELSMCLWGQSFWAIERRRGVPAEIWWLKPSRVRPVPHEEDYLEAFLYEPIVGGPPIRFETDEIVWFRYPNPIDEFSALSPLAAARLAADTSSGMMQANRNLFRDGLMMGGLVVPDTDKVTFSEPQAKELEGQLERRWSGVDRAHKWAVLRYEAQFRALGVTPKDAQFVEGLGLTLRKVANAYGIPSPLLNDLEHATLANMREYKLMLWEDGLQPDADFRAEEIEEQLLPMFPRPRPDHVEWDYSAVPALQESQTESWGRERQAIEVGRSTINEIREANGEPPVPWGDVWWAPVNKAAVVDASSTPQGDTSPTSMPDDEDDDEQAMPGGMRLLKPFDDFTAPAMNGRTR